MRHGAAASTQGAATLAIALKAIGIGRARMYSLSAEWRMCRRRYGDDTSRLRYSRGLHSFPGVAMTRLAVTLLASLLFAFPASADDYGSAAIERVTSIYDGDTFRADIRGWPAVIGERIPIRILGIDTPEIRGASDCEERLARAAKQFTVAKLRGAGEIRLEHIERGSFFRLLAEVWIDGESLGQALIEAGHARPYVEGRTGKGWCE